MPALSSLRLGTHVLRRDVRAVEGACLESMYTFTRIEGSNPSLSDRVELLDQEFIVADTRPFAVVNGEPRQVRKEATVIIAPRAKVRRVFATVNSKTG